MVARVAVVMLVTSCAVAAEARPREPVTHDGVRLGHYTLRGSFDGRRASRALLRVGRAGGRICLTRAELGPADDVILEPRLWTSRAVVRRGEWLHVTYRPWGDADLRGAAGVLGRAAAVRRPRNQLEARYRFDGAQVVEQVDNATRYAPEEWLALATKGRWGSTRDAASVRTLHSSGAPSDRYDVTIVPEGYSITELVDYEQAAREVAAELLGTEPFRSYRGLINIHVVRFADANSGLRRGGTVLNTTVREEEFVMPWPDYRAVKAAGRMAPGADAIVVLANDRFRSVAWPGLTLVSAGYYSHYTRQTAVHELGHVIGKLLDEYTEHDASPLDYVVGNGLVEAIVDRTGWGENVTTHREPDRIPWRHWLTDDTPLPTPRDSGHAVGLFEGAFTRTRRWFRPAQTCRMREDDVGFCAVCTEVLIRRLASKAWPLRLEQERLGRDRVRLKLVVDAELPRAPAVGWYMNDVRVSTTAELELQAGALVPGTTRLEGVVQLHEPAVRRAPRGWTTFRYSLRLRTDGRSLWLDAPVRRRGLND